MADQAIKIPEYTYDKLKEIKKNTGLPIRIITARAVDKLEKEYDSTNTRKR